MKNTLTDLNNHLFAQLERLGDETINKEQLEKEIDRSKAINAIAKTAVDNARLALDAETFLAQNPRYKKDSLPKMLEGKKDE